ncbi:TniQ family protein [Marinimicrobium sp. C2-29]|uniref:TniQ family protein n=1 Tax=Marinimicrobium sp. C2-29 TaxID=3139825 RepID=UPI00313A3C2F
MHLLVRPIPYSDEGLKGYLWRLALSNGLPSPGTMASFYKKPDQSPDETLLRICKVNLSEQNYQLLARQKSISSPRYLINTGFRYCPECMARSAYYRLAWEHALLPVCLEHQRLLVNVRSGVINHWVDAEISQKVGESHLGLMFYLADRLGLIYRGRNEVFAALDHLVVDDLQRLILVVGAYAGMKSIAKPLKAPIKGNPEVAYRVLAAASEVLERWPSHVSRLVPQIEDHSLVGRRLKAGIGRFVRVLKNDLVGHQFDFISTGYARYILEIWPDVIDKKAKWVRQWADAQGDLMTGTEYCKNHAMRLDRVVNLIEGGRIDGYVRVLPSGTRQVTVSLTGSATNDQMVELMSFQDLKTYLGLTKKELRVLLHQGVFGYNPRKAGAPWEIDKESVGRVIQALRGGASREGHKDTITLNHYLRYYGSTEETIGTILRDCINGTIPYWIDEPLSQRLTLGLRVRRRLPETEAKIHGLLTVPEACNALGIKQEVGYHLINKGMIRSVGGGRRGRKVRKEDLKAFKRNYVSLSSIAKTYGRPPKALVTTFREHGISFVAGPSVDGCRQYWLRRQAFEKLRFELSGIS